MAVVTGAVVAAVSAVYSAQKTGDAAKAQEKDIKKQAGERDEVKKQNLAEMARERAERSQERRGASGYASTLGSGSRTLGGF